MDSLSLILETFDPIEGRSVLDVGCGHGHLAKALAQRGARVTGIDPNAEAVAAAVRNAPEGRFETARAEALPFPAASFEGIVCLNALHHAGDPSAALAEMARVAAPGARIVVVEPLAEGTFFSAMRPIEDETQVRATAQAAIVQAVASGAFACLREVVFERHERFEDLDRFIERVVAVDPARKVFAEARRPAIAAAFAEHAARDEAGHHRLVQPLRAHVLSAGRRH